MKYNNENNILIKMLKSYSWILQKQANKIFKMIIN